MGYADEAAFSCCSHAQRAYHPRGRPPIWRHGPIRGSVQAISMVTQNGGLYFQVKSGSFGADDVVNFLRSLLFHFRRQKVLLIWDGAPTHRSQIVKDFLRNEAKGRIHLEQLPSYSPELNADEQAHGYIKQHRLVNRLFLNTQELHQAVQQEYEWLKSQPDLIYNFFWHENVGFYQT